jgi:hypothetical protein
MIQTDHKTEHGRRAQQLINDILSDRLSHDRTIQEFVKMDQLFPDYGWAEEAAVLVRSTNRRRHPRSFVERSLPRGDD